MTTQRSLIPIFAALACSACAGNGDGLDENGRPIDASTGGGGVLTADLQSIQDNVFTPICTACHAGASAPLGLSLDAGNSYKNLVGIPRVEVPALQRVRPGDPDNSYIIQKLEGRAAVGGQMPLGGPPLSQATIQVIRQWITEGAQPAASVLSNETRQPVQGADRVVAESTLLQVVPERLVVGFDTQLDASLVNYTTIMLQRRVSDDRFEDIAASAVLNPANSAVILISPRAALAAGQYRLLARGLHGGGVLAGLNGQPLGRDYVFEFELEASQ
ncbi:MAG: hypothetical protein EHM84_02670 [Lysobacterales bacterium]|nr:MAG: hypothetical protein EHM84_02670 [Xanthomonadales bacterium]